MLKAESNQGKMEVELEGTVGEIIAETSAMLHCVYNSLHEGTREMFAEEIHHNTAPGGLCWMTREQRREKAAKMLRELLARVEGKDEEPEGLGMRFAGEPVQRHPDPAGEPGERGVPEELREEFARAIHGDCSLEEMTRNAARMAMEKKEAESGESGT
jgi:hypothetical protein